MELAHNSMSYVSLLILLYFNDFCWDLLLTFCEMMSHKIFTTTNYKFSTTRYIIFIPKVIYHVI